ncbi:Xaa-Pro dipeptidase [Bradyrhizobium sp. LA6.10]|uniref:M24 family metallopeptidase n=1 Tax=Bradyrhizobium sp. LA6.10 TaxID=3156318 RepID=UPI00339B7D8A
MQKQRPPKQLKGKEMSPNSLPFAKEEYERRIRLVRDSMALRGIDVLLVHTPENLNYISGYDTSGYFAYQCIALPAKGDLEILTRRGEAFNAQKTQIAKRTVHFDTDDVVTKTIELVRRFPGSLRIGIEKNSWFLTAGVYERLKHELGPAHLIDCSNLIDVIRLVKSDAEVELIRKAAGIATIAMAAGAKALRVGVSESEIAADVSYAAIKAGSDYTGMPHLIKSGDRCPVGHAQWSRRVLERGDVVFMELSGCVHRYSGVIMRTLQVGTEDKEVKRASEAVIASLNETIAAVRPGVTTGELYAIAITPVVKAGFSPSARRMGYSLGVGYPPRWGEWHAMDFQPNGETVLKPGMAFHIIPAIALNPKATIGFSETVLVTEKGHEVLTNFPREFKVIG